MMYIIYLAAFTQRSASNLVDSGSATGKDYTSGNSFVEIENLHVFHCIITCGQSTCHIHHNSQLVITQAMLHEMVQQNIVFLFWHHH